MFKSSRQYKTVKTLRDGGLGQTSLVKDASDHSKLYVVKVFPGKNKSHEAAQQKKLAELMKGSAELMKTLEHSNILKIITYFQEANAIYLVTEYCESGTLKEAIRAQNGVPFDEAKVCRWIAQLAMALHYLHDRKILHRNVKTDNIFLASDGQDLKLGKIGIENAVENCLNHDVDDSFTDTPPEVWQGEPYTFKSDVWALGVVAYELLALRIPFNAESSSRHGNIAAMCNQICYLDIMALPETFSIELREFVAAKLLQRDLTKRPEMKDVISEPFISEALAVYRALQQVHEEIQQQTIAGPSLTSFVDDADAKSQFTGEYWSAWSVRPVETLPFQAPSYVQAVLTVPTIAADKNSQNPELQSLPSIIVICWTGEVIAFSSMSKWTSIDWSCSVTPPHKMKISSEEFRIWHAVYDAATDEIYFSLHRKPYVFRAARGNLETTAQPPGFFAKLKRGLPPLPLSQLITASSNIFGLSVDPKRRLLFACQPEAKVVGIWQITLPKDDGIQKRSLSPVARLLSAITCVPSPWYAASVFDESSGVVKIAIKSSEHEICVLQADLLKFKECLESRASRGSNSDLSIDEIFLTGDKTYKDFVVGTKRQDDMLGSLNSPEEIIFDRQGHLFVADQYNKRIQIFSCPDSTDEAKSATAVWASQSCTATSLRIAIIPKHPRTGKPAALVAKSNIFTSNSVIEWYY